MGGTIGGGAGFFFRRACPRGFPAKNLRAPSGSLRASSMAPSSASARPSQPGQRARRRPVSRRRQAGRDCNKPASARRASPAWSGCAAQSLLPDLQSPGISAARQGDPQQTQVIRSHGARPQPAEHSQSRGITSQSNRCAGQQPQCVHVIASRSLAARALVRPRLPSHRERRQPTLA